MYKRQSCERTSSSENRLTPDAFADATQVGAFGECIFSHSTSCRTVQPCLRRGRDTTPDRENQPLLGIAGQVRDQRRPGTVSYTHLEERGTHTFVDLSLGKYKLRVSKTGFQTEEFTDVVVQAAQTTDISAALKVGSINETVEVAGGSAPLVETSTNMIGTTIDMKQIEDLPIQGRDLTQLSQLVPGYTGGQTNEGGTWNGLPAIDQGNNVDGVIGSSSRMKFAGNAAPAISPRLESIEEMTVQTEQLDMNQGLSLIHI